MTTYSLRVLPRFPAEVTTTGPVTLDQLGVGYSFGFDIGLLGENFSPNPGQTYVITRNALTGAHDKVLVTNLPAGQAPGSVGTASLADGAVTFVKMQDVPQDSVLGRFAIGSGDVQAASLGAGISYVSGVLTPDAALILNQLGTTRGALATVGASGWTIIAPGTSGYLLKSNGAGADPTWIPASGTGDVVGPASSVDSELALFNSTTGKLIKRATTTGIVKATSGVVGVAVAGTDYVAPGTATAFTAQQYATLVTLTDGANISWTVSGAQKAQVTISGNRTMNAVTGAVAGASYFLWVIQDATGSRTLTWTTTGAGSFDFGTDGAPTLTTTASRADLLCFEAITIAGTLKLRFAGIKKGFA